MLTRSKPFQTLLKKTFEQVDTAKNNEVDKTELYAGLLMVHLKLAKFAGPAACYVSVYDGTEESWACCWREVRHSSYFCSFFETLKQCIWQYHTMNRQSTTLMHESSSHNNNYSHSTQPPSKDACDKLFDAADTDNSGGISCEEFSRILGVLCAQIMFRMLVYYCVLILFVPALSTRVVDALEITNGSYTEMFAEQIISMSVFFGAIPTIWNTIDEGAKEKVGEIASTHAAEKAEAEKAEADKKDD